MITSIQGKHCAGMSLFAPPAAVNDAAQSSGSGQVRAVGGAPLTSSFLLRALIRTYNGPRFGSFPFADQCAHVCLMRALAISIIGHGC